MQEKEVVDFDGDLDVLVSYWVDTDNRFGRSYLFENIDGNGTAWTYHELKNFLNDRTYSRAGDINNDGRLDVAVMEQDFGRSNDEQLSWFDVGSFTLNSSVAIPFRMPAKVDARRAARDFLVLPR